MNNSLSNPLLDAKRKLYLLLLKKDINKLSNNEVDLMFLLSKDEQIQKLLNDNKIVPFRY